jgi:hypothetical protein
LDPPAEVLTAAFRVLFVGPVARLTIRVVAWRLAFFRIRPSQIGRNESLATATKVAAGGRCAACGATGPLEADHYRPRWAGGAESASNLQALCHRCHDVKSKAERKVRERLRRWRARNGSGHFQPTAVMARHRWILAGLAAFGLIDGAFGVLSWWWRLAVVAVFLIGVRWQIKRRGRIAGQDGMVRFDAKDERQRYADTLAGDHVAVTQAIEVGKLRTRAAMIWFPGAYLLALFAAVLAGV